MKTLISMTDFVLSNEVKSTLEYSDSYKIIRSYAQFLKQPLTLGMFVPCDEDGNVLEEPKNYELWIKRALNIPYDLDLSKYEKYQQAIERVLFEGFELLNKSTERVTWRSANFDFSMSTFSNIEGMSHLPLTLTPYALKQIGL